MIYDYKLASCATSFWLSAHLDGCSGGKCLRPMASAVGTKQENAPQARRLA